MDRLFTRSNTAKWFKLNKFWDFIIDPNEKGKEEKWYENFPANKERMYVPSCWNTTLGYFQYMGTAWYKTDFEINSDSIYLKFEGVANECDVYLDNKFIGHHYGAFVEFGFELLNIGKGKHELVLRVNNTLNSTDTIPHITTDWYNFGGINRGVEILEINNLYIKSTQVCYDLNGNNANVLVKANIKTLTKITDNLEVLVDGKSVYSKEVTIDGDAEIVADGIKLNDLKLWDIKEPNLYYFTVKFGGQDLIDRVGFRTIKTQGKDILLNGKKVTLVGVNRHEEHPDWGFSVPFEISKRDVEIILELNSNTIRGSHYPNTKKFIDYLDEVGLLFWEEIPLWGNNGLWAESFKNPDFIERSINYYKDMVVRDLNHPSIVFWGLHNEVNTTLEQTRELSKKLIEVIRKYDTSKLRLITYASNVGERDECIDLVDVISYNKYIGWYYPESMENLDDYIANIRKKVNELSKGDKPIIMSEFGGAAVKGHTSYEHMRWSENYQAEYLKKHIETFFNSGEICGTLIWQFCDAHTQNENYLSKPRGYNNKGIVSEYRLPKTAFFTVKDLFKKYNPKANKDREFKMF